MMYLWRIAVNQHKSYHILQGSQGVQLMLEENRTHGFSHQRAQKLFSKVDCFLKTLGVSLLEFCTHLSRGDCNCCLIYLKCLGKHYTYGFQELTFPIPLPSILERRCELEGKAVKKHSQLENRKSFICFKENNGFRPVDFIL